MAVQVGKKDLSDANEKFPDLLDPDGHFSGPSEREQEVRDWVKLRRAGRKGTPRLPSRTVGLYAQGPD